MEPSVDDVPIVTVIVQDWQPQQVPIKDQTAASPASAHTSQDAAVIDIPVQQDQQQTRTGGLCRTLAAAARIYRTPECWGRPDDTVGRCLQRQAAPTLGVLCSRSHSSCFSKLPPAAAVLSSEACSSRLRACTCRRRPFRSNGSCDSQSGVSSMP